MSNSPEQSLDKRKGGQKPGPAFWNWVRGGANLRRLRKGQGLLETTVAFFVLITGIVMLMALVVAGAVGRLANEKQTVAVNLAREAIEAVIAKRNTNWINSLPFDEGLHDGTDYTFAPVLTPCPPVWDFIPDENAITDVYAKVYRLTSGVHQGMLVQTADGNLPGEPAVYSGFDRLVTIDPICYNGTTESVVTSGSTCGAAVPGKIGVRITSAVRWSEKNGIHNVSVVENIYDWR